MLKFIMILMLMIVTSNSSSKIMLATTMILFNLSMQGHFISKMSYVMMGDLTSFWMTNMTLIIMLSVLFTSSTPDKVYFTIMNMTTMILVMTFFSWNFIIFYMLFEMSMVMILLVVISRGYQPERTEAMMFMIVMTLMFSLPLLTAMMQKHKKLNFWFMELDTNLMVTMAFLFVFMMKMPMYFMHVWLPKMHVEAPVEGSIILAAIMLKLGCYGIMRMNKMMMKLIEINPYLMSIALWSSIILSMVCLMQIDLKTMIAYSSVVHMAPVFMNMMTLKSKSLMGSVLVILGHAFSSAALFMMANMMYENSKSRSILINKSVLTLTPPTVFMWFASCMSNAPMPPTMSMVGEFLSIKSIMNWSAPLTPLLFVSAFISSTFSIYMFCVMSQGKMTNMVKSIKMNESKSFLTMTILITPATLISIKTAMLAT